MTKPVFDLDEADDLTPKDRALAELGPRKAPRRKRTYNVLDVAKARSCSTEAALRWLKLHALSHLRTVRGEWTIRVDVYKRLDNAVAFEAVNRRLRLVEESHAELRHTLALLEKENRS